MIHLADLAAAILAVSLFLGASHATWWDYSGRNTDSDRSVCRVLAGLPWAATSPRAIGASYILQGTIHAGKQAIFRMGSRRQLALEPLESRQLLSGNASPSHFLIGEGALSSTAGSDAVPTVAAGIPSLRQLLGSGSSIASGRWDWLADTVWYVPAENMLAYSADLQLADPQPIADQTLWYINESSGGHFTGESVAKLSLSPVPSRTSFSGIVTASGQIRMEFTGQTVTTGIGQMRFVDGAWRAQMQMATGSNSVVTHWAYMFELPPNTAPPEPSGPPLDENLLSNEWRWLVGTRWALADTALFGSASAGVFEIDSFRNGYFWGSGTQTQPFNVLGSVTPEGNLLLLVSQAGAGSQPAVRTGILQQTSSGGTMTLRTYEGTPAVGFAWTLPDPSPHPTPTGPSPPSMRALLGSEMTAGN